jgi:exopolysaccharide biosynthesis WecB/TagA/CpsF family protein
MAPVMEFLGLPFSGGNLPDILRRIAARDLRRAPFVYVVTPNADHIVRLRRQPDLRPLYDAAWSVLLDSRLMALAARALGLACPPVVTGADLTAALLPALAGRRAAIIGMSRASVCALTARYPQIDWVHHNPPPNLLDDAPAQAAAVAFALAAQAEIIFLAVGSPVQEILAAAIARSSGATGLGLCIGSALDFAAGTRPRAPVWMRRAGLEWAFRLAQEPTRLAARYLLRDPQIFAALVMERRQKSR